LKLLHTYSDTVLLSILYKGNVVTSIDLQNTCNN